MLSSVAKKTRKSLTLDVKLDIIHRHERGEKTNSIARHHLDSIYCLYYFQVSKLLLRRLALAVSSYFRKSGIIGSGACVLMLVLVLGRVLSRSRSRSVSSSGSEKAARKSRDKEKKTRKKSSSSDSSSSRR
ncbi:hypothetical protein E2C01_026849 [Portunus trituberculatus]|uniref:HTH psq-type domain-containing protein n=1 Tax=Portunus trituberculatus TaxID=210409 RepID=A0A5B7EJS2_PORTR|nr:hypothetical protein [Portunus trituberculatus]